MLLLSLKNSSQYFHNFRFCYNRGFYDGKKSIRFSEARKGHFKKFSSSGFVPNCNFFNQHPFCINNIYRFCCPKHYIEWIVCIFNAATADKIDNVVYIRWNQPAWSLNKKILFLPCRNYKGLVACFEFKTMSTGQIFINVMFKIICFENIALTTTKPGRPYFRRCWCWVFWTCFLSKMIWLNNYLNFYRVYWYFFYPP